MAEGVPSSAVVPLGPPFASCPPFFCHVDSPKCSKSFWDSTMRSHALRGRAVEMYIRLVSSGWQQGHVTHFRWAVKMGRIVAVVKIENLEDPDAKIRCDALVDAGASYMVLPNAWRDRLGELDEIAKAPLETATRETVEGTICGPLRLQIEGFRSIYNEVLFIDMEPANGEYEPLIGYVIIEQCQAAVDVLGHRLIPVKRMDLK